MMMILTVCMRILQNEIELFSNIKLNKLIKIINLAERTTKFSSVKLQYLREDIFQEHINFLPLKYNS